MSSICRLLFVLFCSTLFVSSSLAQDFPMLHYTVAQGLPSNVIYSVFRDSKGYMWLCTDKGVVRTNGLMFETFSAFNGLPDNEIFAAQEDYYGRIWFATFNGELCYYQDGLFHTASNTPLLVMPKKFPHVWRVSNEYDSSVMITFDNNMRFIVIKDNKTQLFDLHNVNYPDIASHALIIKKISPDNYRILCKDRMIFIDSSYHVRRVEMLDAAFRSEKKYTYCQSQEYVYDSGSFYSLDMNKIGSSKRGLLRPYFLHQIYLDDSKNIMFATRNGVVINDTFQLLKGANVSSVSQDILGNYWISTLNSGVFVLKRNYRDTRMYKDVYKGVAKYAVVRKGSLFFATTDNSLYRINNGNVKLMFNYASFVKKPYDELTDFGFYIDSNCRYYNSYYDDAFIVNNITAENVMVERHKYAQAKEIQAAGGYLYLRQSQYLRRSVFFNFARDTTITADVINPYGNDRIFCMAPAGDSTVWFSTVNGLHYVDSGLQQVKRIPWFKAMSLKNFIFFGRYLLGYTHKNDLLVCDNVNSPEVHIDTIPPRNCIWDKFYVVDSTHVLISTNNYYRLLTVERGNSGPRFIVRAIEDNFLPLAAEAICSDGYSWYFLKEGSLTVMNGESLLYEPTAPRLFFTQVKAGKSSYKVVDNVELAFSESRNIVLSFSSVAFGSCELVYQYSISSSGEDNWTEVKGDEIYLARPASGTYTVKLRARSLSGSFCRPISFTLHILRPFWLSWWFITLCCVGLAMIAGWAIRYRIVYLLRKKERAHALELKFLKSEYKALNALMNPHFIFNTLNNVQGLVNRNDKLAANEYIRVFADLIRQNMHNISKEMITLQSEMNLVSNYLLLEKLRFKNHLNYVIMVDPNVDLDDVMVPPLLVQPLVENSIKHGILPLESGEGEVRVHIFDRGEMLVIEVSDNGIGIDTHKTGEQGSHESYGLDNIRKRIGQLSVILDKQILFDMGQRLDKDGVKWTVVTISLPLSV